MCPSLCLYATQKRVFFVLNYFLYYRYIHRQFDIKFFFELSINKKIVFVIVPFMYLNEIFMPLCHPKRVFFFILNYFLYYRYMHIPFDIKIFFELSINKKNRFCYRYIYVFKWNLCFYTFVVIDIEILFLCKRNSKIFLCYRYIKNVLLSVGT